MTSREQPFDGAESQPQCKLVIQCPVSLLGRATLALANHEVLDLVRLVVIEDAANDSAGHTQPHRRLQVSLCEDGMVGTNDHDAAAGLGNAAPPRVLGMHTSDTSTAATVLGSECCMAQWFDRACDYAEEWASEVRYSESFLGPELPCSDGGTAMQPQRQQQWEGENSDGMTEVAVEDEQGDSLGDTWAPGRPPDTTTADEDWALDMDDAALTLNCFDIMGVRMTGSTCAFAVEYLKARPQGQARQSRKARKAEAKAKAAATAQTQMEEHVQFILSADITSAMNDMFAKTLDSARAEEASAKWAQQTEILRRGVALLHAGAIDLVKANAIINHMCDSMTEAWATTVDCTPTSSSDVAHPQLP